VSEQQERWSGARGAACGLAAAALFGLSAPVAKLLLGQVSPLWLAGIFYLGSGGALAVLRAVRPAVHEARLERADVPTLAGIVVLGGMVGPVLMLWGLQRTSALTGSLLLNLEAPFTMLVAVLLFREHMGKQAAAAAVCIVLGAALLKLEPGQLAGDLSGALAIAGACAAWAFDNNLTQRLSLRDPFALVRTKALIAGACNVLLALVWGQPAPSWRSAAVGLVVGAFCYGASVVLDAYALRFIGAAREAAYFAMAPVVGVAASIAIVGDALSAGDVFSMLLMGCGVILLLRERHGHQHAHAQLAHTHLHTHDDHHRHEHRPGDPPGEPHAHTHAHLPLVHDHPHAPDLHHRHRH
jgi:drug/metabolite transporter (DMT)-like permease